MDTRTANILSDAAADIRIDDPDGWAEAIQRAEQRRQEKEMYDNPTIYGGWKAGYFPDDVIQRLGNKMYPNDSPHDVVGIIDADWLDGDDPDGADMMAPYHIGHKAFAIVAMPFVLAFHIVRGMF